MKTTNVTAKTGLKRKSPTARSTASGRNQMNLHDEMAVLGSKHKQILEKAVDTLGTVCLEVENSRLRLQGERALGRITDLISKQFSS